MRIVFRTLDGQKVFDFLIESSMSMRDIQDTAAEVGEQQEIDMKFVNVYIEEG